jgi:hypothetical protein
MVVQCMARRLDFGNELQVSDVHDSGFYGGNGGTWVWQQMPGSPFFVRLSMAHGFVAGCLSLPMMFPLIQIQTSS